jgi:hypothetical protein
MCVKNRELKFQTGQSQTVEDAELQGNMFYRFTDAQKYSDLKVIQFRNIVEFQPIIYLRASSADNQSNCMSALHLYMLLTHAVIRLFDLL